MLLKIYFTSSIKLCYLDIGSFIHESYFLTVRKLKIGIWWRVVVFKMPEFSFLSNLYTLLLYCLYLLIFYLHLWSYILNLLSTLQLFFDDKSDISDTTFDLMDHFSNFLCNSTNTLRKGHLRNYL